MPKKLVIDIRKPPERKKNFSTNFSTPVYASFKKDQAVLPLKSVSGSKPKYFRPIFLAVLLVLVLLTSFAAVGFADLKKAAVRAAPELYEKFLEAKDSLANLETAKAKNSLENIEAKLDSLKIKADRYGLIKISELWGNAVPKLKAVPVIFKNVGALTASALAFISDLENLKMNAFFWLTHQKGEFFITALKNMQAALHNFSEADKSIREHASELASLGAGGGLMELDFNIGKTGLVLSAFTRWFDDGTEKHILILFQNPSEMRPAGGFLGSYADAVLTKNGLQEIKVWDIYDTDGQFDLKVVPPKPLQGVTPRWGARDANWFFDFPTSAGKVIDFLEKSKIYSERGITFEGALAINTEVLRTLLAITGPLDIPGYNLVLGSENFTEEIQREVESGPDNRAGEPKRILKVLTPILFEKIGALGDEQKIVLLKAFKDHTEKKDIMAYFRDWEIENYFKELGIAGDAARVPENVIGDYLAVVNANIAGGKSDAVISQTIRLSSKIEESGRIENYLEIEKNHRGDEKKEKWYRAPNKSYLKVFTVLGSRLTYLNGNEKRTVKPTVDYFAQGYLSDPDLRVIEESAEPIPEFGAEQMEESEKNVFASWFSVKPGETKKLELQYVNPTKLTLDGKPISYRFIFDKQSGSKSSLDFLIEAPSGYLWRENNEKLFNYVTADPPARVVIDLTLVPDPAANQRWRE